MNWDTFHFLRPAWLAALLLLVPMVIAIWRLASESSAWRGVCDSHLLRHLLVEADGSRRAWPAALFALGWITTTLALAGPTWEKLPTPTFALSEPTVFVLNMSPSMNATDTAPSRMTRARYKLIDAIGHIDGAPAGLVIFNEEPYVVTPVTDDGKVIAATVPILTTDLMPGHGMRVDRALAEATDLIAKAGATTGRILLVTDGAGDAPYDAVTSARAANEAGYPVSVLSVGDESAAERLADIASAGGGAYAALTADGRDLDITLPERALDPSLLSASASDPSSARADVWRDMGGWLVIVPLLLALAAFRRGSAVACSGFLAMALVAPGARAGEVGDLFRTPDQRGQVAFEAGRLDEAAAAFENPAWRGAAEYRSGDYESAIETLQGLPDVESRYNLGNALARSQRLKDAIAAYDEVLASQPDHEDARHNRDLVQQLLDQQKQQQQDQQQQQQDDQQQGEDDSQRDDSQQQDSSQDSGSEGDESADDPQSQASEQGSQQEPPSGQQDESGDQDSSPQDSQGSAGQEPQSQDGGESGEQAEQPQDAESGAGADSEAEPSDPQADERPAAKGGDGQPESEPQPASPTSGQPGSADAPDRPQRSEGADESQEPDEQRDGGQPDPRSAQPTDDEPTSDTPVPLPSELSEADQATESLLSRIPDDPGGLLREKLRRRYLRDRYGRLPRGYR